MRIDHLTVEDWVNVDPHRLQVFGRHLTRRIGRWLFRYHSYGRERIPVEGPFIIAPNHGSYLDGFFFLHGTHRCVRFMGKHQALRWPLVGRVIRWGGGFPVERGKEGQPALEIARQVLANGQGLIMFMEGKLIRDPGLGEPKRGLAVLALQTGAAVVPVGAYGNKPAWVFGRRRRPWGAKTTVVWGEPIRFAVVPEPSDAAIVAARDEIWAEVTRLHDIARELHTREGGRPRDFVVPPRPVAGA